MSSLSAWDWIDFGSLAFVFFGVWFGHIATKNKSPAAGFWEGILILGLGVEMVAFPRHVKEIVRLRKESGIADKQAALANDRASSNEVQVQIIKSQNLILRSNVAVLEIKVRPRTITAEQETNLVNILKPFVEKNSNSSNRVLVEHVLSDSDSDKYARRLYSILKECGFDVDLVGGIPMEPSPNIIGLVINVRDPHNVPPQADAILNAFKVVGITPSDPISSGHNPSVEPGAVEIMVGKKGIE